MHDHYRAAQPGAIFDAAMQKAGRVEAMQIKIARHHPAREQGQRPVRRYGTMFRSDAVLDRRTI